MGGFWDYVSPTGKKNPLYKAASKFWGGSKEKHKQVPTLLPEQMDLFNQAVNAGMKPGAGGAFGQAADYYRDLMSDNPKDMAAFSAPALRQYNEEIIPGISEQFAGMGSGGLSSSGFRNAQVQGATDLTERLGALRAQLRQHGAQGLQQIGEVGLRNYSQDRMTQQGSPGFMSQAAPLVGAAAGMFFGGPAGAAAGYGAGNAASGWMNKGISGNQASSNSGPYGSNGPQASPQWR